MRRVLVELEVRKALEEERVATAVGMGQQGRWKSWDDGKVCMIDLLVERYNGDTLERYAFLVKQIPHPRKLHMQP
jgi:hypothetical protein